MNPIPTTTELPTHESYKVEFYPAIDDYVVIASRISLSVSPPAWLAYVYYGFLFLNTLLFPAFLFLNDYLVAAAAVFILNLIAVSWIVPKVNTEAYRNYYQQIFGNRENEIATVELNSAGVTYNSNGGTSFWPWRRFSEIEETEDSIFFFFDGNGFAVRKSGFPYAEVAKEFVKLARHNLKIATQNRIRSDRQPPTQSQN